MMIWTAQVFENFLRMFDALPLAEKHEIAEVMLPRLQHLEGGPSDLSPISGSYTDEMRIEKSTS